MHWKETPEIFLPCSVLFPLQTASQLLLSNSWSSAAMGKEVVAYMPAPMNLEILVIPASKSIWMSSIPAVSHKISSCWGMCLMSSSTWKMRRVTHVCKMLLSFQLAHCYFHLVKWKACGLPERFNSVSFSIYWVDRKKQEAWKGHFVNPFNTASSRQQILLAHLMAGLNDLNGLFQH